MGFALFGSIFIFSLFFKSNLGQQQEQSMANTDEFFISQFFEKMGINSSSSSHVYNLSSSVCSWEIVFCDAKQENVIGLVAPDLGLTGSIPDNTIGKLRKLQYLDLSSNGITDFPSDFWSLVSIKTLNLSNNKFSINLPTNIGNFGLLERLDLSFNNFSGSLPDSLSSLTSLQLLNLNQNQFDSIIPLGFISCHSLISIDLSFNRFHGSLPDGFNTAFPKLKSLNLAGNGITGRGSDFSKMVSVTYLNISKNLFKGSVVEIFQGPLEVVDLSSNQFEGHISKVNFSSTFDWSHLVHLDLSDNEISGQFFSNLNQTHNLKHLNLANNRFSKQTFIHIDELHSLEYLNLSKTNLIGRIADGITMLTHLKTLDLSNNHLAGKPPLLSFKTLQNLDLSNNNLTGDIPMSLLQKLPWMERFNFSYNNLTLCDYEFSLETLQSAFIGCSNSCPIAANPTLFKRKPHRHRGLELALALAVTLVCLLVALLLCAFGCRRKTRMWDVKQESCNEEHAISGPFSFKTDSTTWVADVKIASLVPVVIFEKPLLDFTFSDLLSATSNFDRGTLLAEGRFGPVYRGFLPGGIHVAVKVLVHGSTMTDHEAARELEYLGRIKHPNLVPLTGYCLAGEQRIAIYDYMENGNLHNLLHDLPLGVQTTEDWSSDTWEADESNSNGIQNVGSEGLLTTWQFRHKVALGTARALAFLHHGCSPPIIHRDVKASSVYLDYNLEPRLSDFGLAKIFGNSVDDETAHGSPRYTPPDDTITPKSDVYGFGVILLELITGKKPVGDEYLDDDNSKAPNLVSWVRGLVRMNRGSRAIDPKIRTTGDECQMVEGLKIGYLCTADLPAKRPSMQQVVGLLKDIEPLRASEEI
ncbi:probable LRR receptor-like serine/threonine-protein kinase At2g24230 [Cynara cardunculus var. scolymus]|uniref:Concanavalin A-like lectin/glucanase, subgroup n=1 Tax=Cynara cardunculus var. scolymus TaxID=59895 RepID=A0A124SCF7_CYNCS|nr:probable LRR receptor-like serine/threonine-protein kinase At2g24230 [Cynara cardunculus var. scolymus]KVH93640.1 Concanavalin A-like lectin/glucanase, subgroup [Cynara cardunculus var. scolymus]